MTIGAVVRGRSGRGCVLDPDDACDGVGQRPAAALTQSRKWPHHVSGRWLLVLPRRAEAGPAAARRWARAELAVRHLLRAEYFIRSEGRHRQLERGPIRHRDDERHLAATASIYFPAFPYTSYQRMTLEDRARPVRATSRRCRRCRARCATTTCRFRSMCGARSAAGSSCSSTASRSSRIRRNPRNGIAAPIW